MSRHSLFHFPEVPTPVATGHFEVLLPVFKTGRAGQPPAWKVRFLRRVAPAFASYCTDSGPPPGLMPSSPLR